MKAIAVSFAMALLIQSAHADGLSPDGTILLPGTGGSLITSGGTWTFGPKLSGVNYYTYLNGKWVGGGGASEMEVANGGNLYTVQWYLWSGGKWVLSAAPGTATPPPPPPPPGTATAFPGALIVPVRHIKAATDAPISATADYWLCVDNLAVSPQLPSAPPAGLSYLIKDCTGAASSMTPLTILPSSGATIERLSAYQLTTPGQWVSITYDALTNTWRLD